MDIKKIVKEKYGSVAGRQTSACSCGSSCCADGAGGYKMADDYTEIEGYVKDADLGLGCGIPTQFANIKENDTVIDLGSGAGNDAFICAKLTGKSGRVIGVDMTEEMITKARGVSEKMNFSNVEFRLGDIEKLPVEDNIADVVVSNCVLNLVPDKNKAFSEIFRVLKNGGHFCISDIVLTEILPKTIKKAAELYTGCISGAILLDEYTAIIKKQGFKNISIPIKKNIPFPEQELKSILKENYKETDYKSLKGAILSVTITGEKQY